MKVLFDPPGEFRFELDVDCLFPGMQVLRLDEGSNDGDLYEVTNVRAIVEPVFREPYYVAYCTHRGRTSK